MSIGSITSTGKQNVESGGGVYLVTMKWTVKVSNSQNLTMRTYAYTGRMINNVNDFVDYIHEKGYRQSDSSYYYPCHASLGYSGVLLIAIQLTGEIYYGDRSLFMDYYMSWLPGTYTADQTNLTSFSCVKL